MTTAMSKQDAARLKELEAIVDKNLRSLHHVGTALMEIRDSKLYRDTHKTFQQYVEERFSISRPRAYQLIDACTLVDKMSTTVDKNTPSFPVLNERQARALIAVPEEQREEVVQRAKERAGGNGLTARAIREAAADLQPEDVEFETPEEDDDSHATGTTEWKNAISVIDALRVHANEILREIDCLPEGVGFEAASLARNSLKNMLADFKSRVVAVTPYKSCPYCLNVDSECEACLNRGWVNRHQWDVAPKPMKARLIEMETEKTRHSVTIK